MFVGPGDGRKVHAHGEERKLGNDDDLAVLYKQRGLQRRNDNTSVATAYFPPKQKSLAINYCLLLGGFP